ncbi:MAG: hypothetical protein BGO68_04855 [Candidatus Amoebophilus sp. 36-38]|nr:MAG: hypothetical protein BGO68_04855 [Candidatus Amoebophilus sp. 36-38]
MQTKEGVWLGRQQETIHIKIKEKGKLEIQIDPQNITLRDDEITIPITLKNVGNTTIYLQSLTYDFSISDGTNSVYQTSLSGSSITWNANSINQGEEQPFIISIDKATRDLLVTKKDITNYPLHLIIQDAETDIVGQLQQPFGLKIGPIPGESRVDIEVLLSETKKFPIYKKLKRNGNIKYKIQVNPKDLPLTIKNISNHLLRLGDLYFDFRFIRSKDGLASFQEGEYCEEIYQINFDNSHKQTVLIYQGHTDDLSNALSSVPGKVHNHTIPRTNDEEAKNSFVTGMIRGYPIALQIQVFAKKANGTTYELDRKKVELPPQYIDIITIPPKTNP